MKESRGLHTFPLSTGLLDPRHVQAIDPSSPWPIYLWFLEHVTRDEERDGDFVGIVLYGRLISIRQIAQELGIKERACRRYLVRLVKAGYVLQKQTGAGCTYEVAKSKRWAWMRRTRASRNQTSKAPESQASLSFQTDGELSDPPNQKVVRGGSTPPHQKVVTPPNQKVVSRPTPPNQILVKPYQKVVSPERGTRARSQESQRSKPSQKAKPLTPRIGRHSKSAGGRKSKNRESDLTDQVLRIASEHPRLEHLEGEMPSRDEEQAIVDAIVRDGFACVMEGTRILREEVGHWEEEEHRFAPNPVKFYQKREYRKKASAWKRSNNASTKLSGAQERKQQRARENITASIHERIGPNVGSGSRDDGARTDEGRDGPVDGQALARVC